MSDGLVRPDKPNTLVPYGWAPGGYIAKCHDCGVMHMDSDKRSMRCLPCALAARDKELDDRIEALEAVVEAARTFLDTSFDFDSLRCPMCRAQHKDGHNRWCWTQPLKDALARLDAQKDKSHD